MPQVMTKKTIETAYASPKIAKLKTKKINYKIFCNRFRVIRVYKKIGMLRASRHAPRFTTVYFGENEISSYKETIFVYSGFSACTRSVRMQINIGSKVSQKLRH